MISYYNNRVKCDLKLIDFSVISIFWVIIMDGGYIDE